MRACADAGQVLWGAPGSFCSGQNQQRLRGAIKPSQVGCTQIFDPTKLLPLLVGILV